MQEKMYKIGKSLENINWRLYLSLVVMGLCPSIYTTVRIFFIGQLPDEWAYSIAGQLTWVNLLYEIVNESIILPLFFFVGEVVSNKREFINRIKTGLLLTLCIYVIFSAIIFSFSEQMLSVMATTPNIIPASATYIRIESVGNVFNVLSSFVLVALISIGRDRYIYIFTIIKLLLCVIFDMFLVSTLPYSLNLGINGIGVSNIIVNAILFSTAIFLLKKEGYFVFDKGKMSFGWIKDFARVGSISGIESLVRNIAYILMVSRMVNIVGESGTYWVVNNFIWGWLLLPVTQLGELVKRETSIDEKAVRNNSRGYFFITFLICISWIILIPTYKPFMQYILGYDNVEKLFNIVMVLLGFYMVYAIQNVFDSTFYGRGKTNYMLLESVMTNTLYYGTFFVLYITGHWVPTLTGIILMFGFGNVFDAIVSGVVYAFFLKKYSIKGVNN